jgi:hypothetical protein
MIRRITSVAALLLIVACSGSNEIDRQWTEDIALDDGRVIEVHRRVSFVATESASGDAYNARETVSELSFAKDLAGIPTWQDVLMPMVLYQDREAEEWVIVSTTTDCDLWFKRGLPWPSYWEFRLRSGKWEEVQLSNASANRPANILIAYHTDNLPDHITVEDKKARDRRAFIRYKQVMSEWDGLICGETKEEWKVRTSNGNSATN